MNLSSRFSRLVGESEFTAIKESVCVWVRACVGPPVTGDVNSVGVLWIFSSTFKKCEVNLGTCCMKVMKFSGGTEASNC